MPDTLSKNALNFSAGPGVLPATVLEEAQQAIRALPGVGLSVLGVSHRSDWFAGVLAEAEANLRRLLRLPDDYAVLFLQGGATQQFSMIPMRLLRASGKTADYLRTGYWSDKAIAPARCEGSVRIAWDGAPSGFRRLPEKDEAALSPQAAYLHYTSNETVDGLQFHDVPGTAGVPLVCDMSSDFLSRPLAPARFDLIYAHAQKNLGPAGVTVVILRRALLQNVPPGLPEYFDYRAHAAAGSLYNTPPVFAIYVTLLVTRWLLHDIGGLEKMAAINHTKAALLYRALDESAGFYQGWVAREHRSLMNVVFRLADAELERKFLQAAEAEGFSGLPGHRARGGVRASLYNAMTPEAVEALVAFMAHFRQQHG